MNKKDIKKGIWLDINGLTEDEAQTKAILNREDADYIIHRLEEWYQEHGNENPFIKDNIHCFLYGDEDKKPMYKVGDTIHYNSFGEPKNVVI